MEPIIQKSKRDFFTTFRYFRRPHGAMSAACVVHKQLDDKYTITFGLSFCNPKDMFSRKEGRERAMKRLMESPIVIKDAENIAGAIIKYVKESWDNLDKTTFELFGVKEYSSKKEVLKDFERWAHRFIDEL